jgi:hypothetical protein
VNFSNASLSLAVGTASGKVSLLNLAWLEKLDHPAELLKESESKYLLQVEISLSAGASIPSQWSRQR